jgi:DNA-directed RNA polymerase subunit H (RpoH/RPB5)
VKTVANMDIEEVKGLLEWAKTSDPNYPWMERDFYDPLLIALGDDEEEVIRFIKDADENAQLWLSDIIEELQDKFPSEEMKAVLDELEEKTSP